jgi:hypothetical protein
LKITTQHTGPHNAFAISCYVAFAGLAGLGMLMDRVEIEGLLAIVVVLFFATVALAAPMITNRELERVRDLSWECYSELISHSLLHKGAEDEDPSSSPLEYFEYKDVVNSAKHLLVLVQNSKEGLKIGSKEYSSDLIKNLWRIAFSAGVILARTGDWSQVACLGDYSAAERLGENATLADAIRVINEL